MNLSAGTRIGPYEILSVIGAGGMGEVYRARDAKLNRDVAIKVLLPNVAGDSDRVARFAREARVLASLNHPNIAQIYGVEETDGVTALVLELVEGEDLAQRIARGPLPTEEALAIAAQIAEALEVAHELGVVHRDLKPANVKVRPDGTVKVLDFGLAKATEAPGSNAAGMVSNSPTLTSPALMTGAGVILGTAAYMSPEQAKGHPADKRSDVWAFGCVLYEMLTGRRPFKGDDVADVLASVLAREPDLGALAPNTPVAIRRLLMRCLRKDRQQRLRDIGDARLDIREALEGIDSGIVPAADSGFKWERRAWVVIAATLALALGVMLVRGRGLATPAPASEWRLDIDVPGRTSPFFALSPDGRSVVVTAYGPRGRQLWVRPLNETTARPLRGTEEGEYPFWSPDSRSIGFFAVNRLKRVDVEGGAPPQALASVFTPAGGTWGADGTILYVPRDSGGVFRVPATPGGESVLVTPRRSPELATRLPQFLPDGRHFLVYVAAGDTPGVYIGELGTDSFQRLLSADFPALYGAGQLWFVRAGVLLTQAFDPSTRALSGSETPVAENVGSGIFSAYISVSAAGQVAYRTGQARPRQLAWFDRSGQPLGTVGEEGSLLSNPSLSADGTRVLMQRTLRQNVDLWLLDLQSGILSKQTSDPGADTMPVWSPDGERATFNTTVGDDGSLAIVRLDGTATIERVLRPASGDGPQLASDWSSDGRFVLYTQFNGTADTADLWALPVNESSKPFQVAHTAADERDGQFSPDGRWVAYESDEAGRGDIYIQQFPAGLKRRVSMDGGTAVRWRRDGQELFYVAPGDRLTAVSFNAADGSPRVGTPVTLFTANFAPVRFSSRPQYVVAKDGKRFLLAASDDPQLSTPPINFVLNWKPLRNIAPAGAPR